MYAVFNDCRIISFYKVRSLNGKLLFLLRFKPFNLIIEHGFLIHKYQALLMKQGKCKILLYCKQNYQK